MPQMAFSVESVQLSLFLLIGVNGAHPPVSFLLAFFNLYSSNHSKKIFIYCDI